MPGLMREVRGNPLLSSFPRKRQAKATDGALQFLGSRFGANGGYRRTAAADQAYASGNSNGEYDTGFEPKFLATSERFKGHGRTQSIRRGSTGFELSSGGSQASGSAESTRVR